MLILRLLVLWTRAKNKAFTLVAKRSLKALGEGSSLMVPINLLGPENISIGSDVLVWPRTIIQSHLGGELRIGDRTEVYEGAVITSQKSVIIESGVGIGRNCHISDHSHDYTDHTLDYVDKPGTVPAPVLIKQGAWVSDAVIVMPGVTIGKRAVVGARSVVTRDVPDYAVVAGTPAKIIRFYGPDAEALAAKSSTDLA